MLRLPPDWKKIWGMRLENGYKAWEKGKMQGIAVRTLFASCQIRGIATADHSNIM